MAKECAVVEKIHAGQLLCCSRSLLWLCWLEK